MNPLIVKCHLHIAGECESEQNTQQHMKELFMQQQNQIQKQYQSGSDGDGEQQHRQENFPVSQQIIQRIAAIQLRRRKKENRQTEQQ